MRTIQQFAAAVALVGAASGCSVYEDFTTSDFAKQDGDAIVLAASKAMQDVTSLRMTGQVRDKGEQYFVDLTVARDDRCTGTVRLGGSNLDVRRVGDRAWVRGESGAFNRLSGSRLSSSALDRLSRSWLEVEGKEAAELCDYDRLLRTFEVVDYGERADRNGGGSDVDDAVPATVGEETTVGGEKVVQLSATPGGSHDEHTWVLSEAPHYVVRLESTSTQDGGTLAFTEFNEDVDVQAPDKKDVFTP